MFHSTARLLVCSVVAVVGLMFIVDMTVFWALFALTLIATTIVAVKRSIPRRER